MMKTNIYHGPVCLSFLCWTLAPSEEASARMLSCTSPSDHQTTLRPLALLQIFHERTHVGGGGGPGQGENTASQLPGPGPRGALRPSCPGPPGGAWGLPAQPAGCFPPPHTGGSGPGAVRMPTSLCCRIPVASPDPLPPCGDSSISFRAKGNVLIEIALSYRLFGKIW